VKRPGGSDGGNGHENDGPEREVRREPASPGRLVRITYNGRPPRERPYPLPPGVSPDQGCFGCAIGIGAIILAALFWGWFYWRLEQRDWERRQNVKPLSQTVPRPPAESRPRSGGTMSRPASNAPPDSGP
jgi:hypothetical protein